MKEVTEKDFDSILKSTVVLVDFYGTSCVPCKQIEPILEELSIDYNNTVKFYKINVADAPVITGRYFISGLPTLMIFKDGKPLKAVIGFKNKETLKEILNHI